MGDWEVTTDSTCLSDRSVHLNSLERNKKVALIQRYYEILGDGEVKKTPQDAEVLATKYANKREFAQLVVSWNANTAFVSSMTYKVMETRNYNWPSGFRWQLKMLFGSPIGATMFAPTLLNQFTCEHTHPLRIALILVVILWNSMCTRSDESRSPEYSTCLTKGPLTQHQKFRGVGPRAEKMVHAVWLQVW